MWSNPDGKCVATTPEQATNLYRYSKGMVPGNVNPNLSLLNKRRLFADGTFAYKFFYVALPSITGFLICVFFFCSLFYIIFGTIRFFYVKSKKPKMPKSALKKKGEKTKGKGKAVSLIDVKDKDSQNKSATFIVPPPSQRKSIKETYSQSLERLYQLLPDPGGKRGQRLKRQSEEGTKTEKSPEADINIASTGTSYRPEQAPDAASEPGQAPDQLPIQEESERAKDGQQLSKPLEQPEVDKTKPKKKIVPPRKEALVLPSKFPRALRYGEKKKPLPLGRKPEATKADPNTKKNVSWTWKEPKEKATDEEKTMEEVNKLKSTTTMLHQALTKTLIDQPAAKDNAPSPNVAEKATEEKPPQKRNSLISLTRSRGTTLHTKVPKLSQKPTYKEQFNMLRHLAAQRKAEADKQKQTKPPTEEADPENKKDNP